MFVKYPKFFLILVSISTIILSNCCSTNNTFATKVIKNEYLELKGSLKISDLAEFELIATRLKQNEDEYLPNSEDFRIEIYNNMGKMIYNSNYNQNYFMVIGKIKPLEIGEEYTYNMAWNFTNNNGKNIPDGEYVAKLIIPAVPNYYYVDLNFTIKR